MFSDLSAESSPGLRWSDGEGDLKHEMMIETFSIQDTVSNDPLTRQSSESNISSSKGVRYYKSRCSIYTGIMLVLVILNLVLSSLLVISFKSKSSPTFLQDYLIGKFHPHEVNSIKFKHTLIDETRVERLNKDREVLPIHSHNDYWRKTPLYDALKLGINSVEADVWYLPSTKDSESNLPELYVGHKRFKLSSYKTLNSLYLSNLEQLLDEVNDHQLSNNNNDTVHGVFDEYPEKTLYFIIDFKTSPNDTLRVLETHLQPFISKNYLTYYNTTSQQFHHGPITIMVSGNIPIELIKQQKIRYTFIDAPLQDPNFANNFDNTNSIYSSSSLKRLTGSKSALGFNGLSDEQKIKLKTKIQLAHEMGIKVRIWDTPNWPITVRNSVWKDLLELGVDLLNADDLLGAVTF